MENQNTQNLAERAANLLQENDRQSDDWLRSSFDKINQRLDGIESQIAFQNPKSNISDLRLNHSSQEKFTNLAELAGEAVNGTPNEKACPFEPTGKPCDHCAMCNSRGF